MEVRRTDPIDLWDQLPHKVRVPNALNSQAHAWCQRHVEDHDEDDPDVILDWDKKWDEEDGVMFAFRYQEHAVEFKLTWL